MALEAFQLHVFDTMASPSKTGTIAVLAALVTTESPTAVEAAGYFNGAAARLPKGSTIFATMSAGGVPVGRTYVVTSNTGSVVAVVRQSDSDAAGTGARAVAPTADGSGTGEIFAEDSMVVVTSAGANDVVKLPLASAATRGQEKWIWVVPSTNCELQTPTGSNQTINNVDSDGPVEALLTHSQLYIARQHLDNGWLLQAFTALGAVATAIVPD